MRINAFLPCSGKWRVVSIYAYSVKGIPTIEIRGLADKNSLFVKKIIHLTQINCITIPKKKYIICIDLPDIHAVDEDSFKYLELPILLLFWHQLGAIPISRLEDCFASGSISLAGRVGHLQLKNKDLKKFNNILSSTYRMQMKYLAPQDNHNLKDIFLIPLEGIFKGRNIYFKI